MFLCGDGWYREVLNGFAGSYTGHNSTAVDFILSVIAPGKNPGEADRDDIFTKLAGYLSSLWKKKRYREVLNFLICARGTTLVDVDKLDAALCEIEHPDMSKVVEISRACAEKVEEEELFDYRFKDWARIVYSSEVLGIDPGIDINNVTDHDIDRINEVAGNQVYFLFRPMLQYLIEREQYEQLWYMLKQYIIPSFCSKNCRTDREASSSLSLLIGELCGVLWNISYINGEIELFLSKNEVLTAMLKASKDGDTETLDKSVKDLLFVDSVYEKVKADRELAESLVTLFYHAIRGNELISREYVEYFCGLILATMVLVGLYNEAADFICTNRNYIQFTSLDKMLLVASIALRSDSFEIVNMIYGIFLTEKTYIDNLRTILSSYLKKSANYLTGIYDRCNHENIDSYYNWMLTLHRESSDDPDSINTKLIKKPIDIFKNKFFIECGVLALCKKADDISDLSDNELMDLTKKLTGAVRCICNDEAEGIYRITGTISKNFLKSEDRYIPTHFIDDKDIMSGKRILNYMATDSSKFNNLKYRNAYNLMNQALLEKQTALYLDNMSEIIENVLSEKPDKYKIYLAEKWDERKAQKLFTETFKSDEVLEYIPVNLRHCLIRPYRSNSRVEYLKRELINYLDESYKKAGAMYDQIYDDTEVKRLLITAEWLWHNEHKSYENAENEIKEHEFTYLIANYLKAIELFIVYKLNKYVERTGRYIEIEQVNRSEGNIQVGLPGWEHKVTMGGLYKGIRNHPELINDDLRAKAGAYIGADGGDINSGRVYYNHPVFNYLKYFADEIRNGYFHKDTVFDFTKAAELRAKTLFVLRRIVTDLK